MERAVPRTKSTSDSVKDVTAGALGHFELDELASAQAREANARYWSSCAEKTRRLAYRHADSATREHFMKTVEGYEALARGARGIRKNRTER